MQASILRRTSILRRLRYYWLKKEIYSCADICESLSRQALSFRRRQTQQRPSVEFEVTSPEHTTQAAGFLMRSASMARRASSIIAAGTMGADGSASGRMGRLRFTFPLYQAAQAGRFRPGSCPKLPLTPAGRCYNHKFMIKTAFIFPGQGSQFAGMGKSLADSYPEAARVFQVADDALGFPLSKLCFEGPEDQLKLTENTQPALLAVSTAACAVLRSHQIEPDFVAGHSLGEYSALVAAGGLDFGEALRLVRKRGQLMQTAVPAGVGAMAALLKLPEAELDRVLSEAAQGECVSASNFNTPDQVVIAGHAGAVSRAADLAKAAGAKRAILLQVSAPFHCALMEPAQQNLKPELEAVTFHDLKVPLVNNWQARAIQTAAEAREGLYQQIPNPVRWTETVRLLVASGVTRFIEVGAGSVLTGMVRTIDPSVATFKFGEAADLEKLTNN